jgi:acetyl-CoA acetyltransferase/uncharacterized OB-fold protein
VVAQRVSGDVITALPDTRGPARFFWTGGADGALLVRWCEPCARHLHPSAELCSGCGAELTTTQVSGSGHVVGCTVNAYPWPGVGSDPYAVVVVELDGASGVRLTSRLVGIDVADARVGLAVRVRFEQVSDVYLPVFEPSGAPDGRARIPEPAPVIRAPSAAERFERRVALTGAGTSEIARRSGRSELALTIDACRAAVADAGLQLTDIDGLVGYPGSPGMPGVGSGGVRAVEQVLGVHPTWHSGGAEVPGQLGGVIAAMLAVAAGLCRHVLCFTAVRRDSLPSDAPAGRLTGEAQWRVPFGAVSPAHWLALGASQYLHRYGADRDTLGWLAVSATRHAARNPAALRGEAITLDDYASARPITSPFGGYDCDVTCDGAFAVVVSATDAARDLPHPVVRVEAVGTQLAEPQSWDQGTLTHQPNVFGPAAHLWSRSELRPSDIDVALLYDGFTFNALTWLEALGFCGVGEAPEFVKDAERIGPGGILPLNPHGGQLCAGRSNGFGFLIEAVQQLRGTAEARQIPGARTAVVSAGGGIPAGCMTLTTER